MNCRRCNKSVPGRYTSYCPHCGEALVGMTHPTNIIFAVAQVASGRRRDVDWAIDDPENFRDVIAKRLKRHDTYNRLSPSQRRVMAEVVRRRVLRADDSATYHGLDARGRPILSEMRHGSRQRWAVCRNGEPANVKEIV